MTKSEARHLVWKHYGIRPAHTVGLVHLENLLLYKESKTPENKVNKLREVLIEYVAKNRGRLSLYCDGNCNNHMDAVVLNCYSQLIEVQEDGKASKG